MFKKKKNELFKKRIKFIINNFLNLYDCFMQYVKNIKLSMYFIKKKFTFVFKHNTNKQLSLGN